MSVLKRKRQDTDDTNLEKEAAIKQAQNWYAQIVAHELKIDVDRTSYGTGVLTGLSSLLQSCEKSPADSF